ncbi:hypothetical protein ACHAXR_002397 [Thalassiosira sp. AJA248-18]
MGDSTSPPTENTSRHTLSPESELRIEIPTGIYCTVTLRHGSAEIFGVELSQERPLHLTGAKVAVFTWHGCTLDISNREKLDILYVSEETEANVAYVNTHAQLEAMRDEALSSFLPNSGGGDGLGSHSANNENKTAEGPRVLLAGPADCGKSSLARVLTAYAVKLGRSPLLVDLDASQNMLSVPGTLSVIPASSDIINADCYCTNSVMSGVHNGAMMPLVLWYGSQDLLSQPYLYKAQLQKLGDVINNRLAGDSEASAAGVIVNASGWIEDVGYEYLLHSIESFQINVVLVLGHDRLYSMLGTYFKKETSRKEAGLESQTRKLTPKLIKLPRSGGVVSRDASCRRATRSECIKRYFYGNSMSPKSPGTTTLALVTPHYQFSPCLLEVPFANVQLHKISNILLSASLLPISAKQSTDPIQLTKIATSEITPKLQHSVLAVCHPSAVQKYEISGSARDLYLAGVAGFVAVEKVNLDKSLLSLLSPCVGSLPSKHLLVGDIFWVE